MTAEAILVTGADEAAVSPREATDVPRGGEAGRAERERFLALVSSGPRTRGELPRLAKSAVPALADWCAIELGGGADRLIVRAPLKAPASALRLHRRGLVRAAHRRVRVLGSGGEGAIIAPIRRGDEVLGAIAFGVTDPAREITPDYLDFARTAALRFADAIRDGDSDEGPDEEAIIGLDVASSMRIAGDGAAGGDFHDVIPVEGGVVLAIGDVCGKGLVAAAPSARVRHTVRTLLEGRGPSDLPLEELNAAVTDLGGGAPFCTLVLAGLAPRVGGGFDATIACAGHPPPLVMRRGASRLAGSPGDLLGVFPDPVFTPEQVELLPGDSLVLYTDGLTDVRAPVSTLDIESLAEEAELGADAGEQLEAIERVSGVGDGSIRDDVAIVVARVT